MLASCSYSTGHPSRASVFGDLGQLSGGSGLICLCFHCNTYVFWVATARFQPWFNREQKSSQEKEVGLRLLWKQDLVIQITTFKNQCPWAPASPQLCQHLYCQLYSQSHKCKSSVRRGLSPFWFYGLWNVCCPAATAQWYVTQKRGIQAAMVSSKF